MPSVTLTFDGGGLLVGCQTVAFGDTDGPVDGDPVPSGYVRLAEIESIHDPAPDDTAPVADSADTLLVADDHVTMIEWED
ncbi:hypothetical protein SAMN05216388_101780 [Halorientalis persicus]|uniref:Uncharacterized protein n=1 Tax=Halorientalis persicus TaxID=1367881 RepID=A0A1H8RYD4_9EURY|nr:hypothetical protein [Halorientalis persicus]SEO71362.1 hypothetical protein SAMN05216388_101780 [Halorientalis persicus]